ncbi:DUF1330 domain-containing protein [Paraglaciecola arctica]|uniref:DUF1330 domain-containing protein n=1 Tax=Paraglaciecola arctica TaxID=1128911 RepID=UPI001C07BA59|nr:DUF1330 domain-containing protein [Paraglaciecola arctica]MBU3002454.1 DUF1330 domain-containing protein [Paraglaciecola arctica]
MTAYSVLDVTPNCNDWVEDYVAQTSSIVARHGGKYIARTSNHERLEGQGENPAMRVIIEWPSIQSAKAFMSDPDYLPHLKARTAGSTSHHFVVEGL